MYPIDHDFISWLFNQVSEWMSKYTPQRCSANEQMIEYIKQIDKWWEKVRNRWKERRSKIQQRAHPAIHNNTSR